MKTKAKRTPKPKATDIFSKKEIGSMPDNCEGKVLILDPKILKAEFRTRNGLLWKATDGFGCMAGLHGTCIMAENLHDGEKSRWERYEFVGEYLPLTSETQAAS